MSEQAKPAHSRFGGSVIGRVIACEGSVAFCASLPPKIETQHMVEGTVAHELGEHCLKNGETDVLRYIGEEFPFMSPALRKLHDNCGMKYRTVSKDMADAVQVYLDTVYGEMATDPAAELYVEQRFTLPVGEDGDVFGSCDALIYLPTRRKAVSIDYKHGAGKPVAVEDNAQPKFYAIGAVTSNPWPLLEVECVIVQPRSPDAVEDHRGVKRWVFPIDDLLEFLADVDRAVKVAKEAERCYAAAKGATADPEFTIPLVAGPHCKSTWCPAQTVCPAAQQAVIDSLGLGDLRIDTLTIADLPEPSTMSLDRIADIMRGAALLKAWVGQVEEFAFNQASAGTPVPGFKLVDKLARRKWITSDEQVLSFLEVCGVDRSEAAPPTLVTITEAEKLLRAAAGDAKAFAPLKEALSLQCTLKESSGLTLAPESDKREAVDAVARAYGTVAIELPAQTL